MLLQTGQQQHATTRSHKLKTQICSKTEANFLHLLHFRLIGAPLRSISRLSRGSVRALFRIDRCEDFSSR
ncbi:hypothetical protein L3X38_013947 [Prunus dulcis]|uniref:Uncharacterized protein n=1 Tax=Prunus dulcis TaxID=3755 RepID=A0AAD4WM62_PRUDU|nr:hypothetical protein L3X38_013947 [Prunus dulcis]